MKLIIVGDTWTDIKSLAMGPLHVTVSSMLIVPFQDFANMPKKMKIFTHNWVTYHFNAKKYINVFFVRRKILNSEKKGA